MRRNFCWAVLITLLAGIAAAVAYWLRSHGPDSLASVLLPDVYTAFDATDNTAQRLAHGIGLLTLFAATAVAMWLGPRLWLPDRQTLRRLETALAIVLIVTLVDWIWTRPKVGWSPELWGGYSILTVPGRPEALLGLLLGAALLGIGLLGVHRARWLPALLLIVVGLDCAMLLLPGFLSPVRLDSVGYGELLPMEAHYGTLLGDRLQLRAGIPLVDIVEPRYGFLLPVLLAMLERAVGAFDLAQNVRLVQVSQVVFLAIYASALLIQARRAWLGPAAALLLVAPWVATTHISIFHPNQAGYRLLDFALGLLALALLARHDASRTRMTHEARLLGAVAGIGLLLNYETGVALGAGITMFIALRLPRADWLRSAVPVALHFTGAFLVVHALYWLIAWLGLGVQPRPLAALFWPLYTDNIAAAIGRPPYFDLWMLAIAAYAAVVFVRATMAARDRTPGPQTTLLAAVAAMILVWLAYWVGAPHLWNDWSYFVLFGPFIVALLRPDNLRRYVALAQRRRLAPGALLVFAIVGPATYASQSQALPVALHVLMRPAPMSPQDGRIVSGVWFSADVADRLEAKAAVIRKVASDGGVVFISSHGFTLTVLTGHPQPLKVREILFDLKTQRQFDAYVHAILALAPRTILINAEIPPKDIPVPQRHIFDALQRSLMSAYALESEADGWRILRRR